MAVLQVTVKEFREKQRSLLDLVDKGAQIVIRRGKKKIIYNHGARGRRYVFYLRNVS